MSSIGRYIGLGLSSVGALVILATGCVIDKRPGCRAEFRATPVEAVTTYFILGDVKSLSDGESMTVGDLTLKVVQSFSSTTAKIEVTDPSGNVVKSGISTGTQESVSYGGSTYNYKVLSSGATASGILGYAQVLAGKGDIEQVIRSNLSGYRLASEEPIELRSGQHRTLANEIYFLFDNNGNKITAYREKETGRIVNSPGEYGVSQQIISRCSAE